MLDLRKIAVQLLQQEQQNRCVALASLLHNKSRLIVKVKDLHISLIRHSLHCLNPRFFRCFFPSSSSCNTLLSSPPCLWIHSLFLNIQIDVFFPYVPNYRPINPTLPHLPSPCKSNSYQLYFTLSLSTPFLP